jgi:ribonuclease HII
MPRHPSSSIPEFVPGVGDCPEQLDVWVRKHGFEIIAGVDEVGRGPLAGPVVAAAVVLPKNHTIEGLADSKALSARVRRILAERICRESIGWGLGVVSAGRIDRINIRQASLEAMALAFQQVMVQGIVPDMILVDGRDIFELPADASEIDQQAVIKADKYSASVSAASIVAKEYRDALMQEYHSWWPVYGFDRHKGYPTAAHKEAVRLNGACEIHRKTFRGVK